MSNHTPGPWKTDEIAGDLVVYNSENVICYTAIMAKNAKANARLIAAAPELLEALKATTQALKDILSAADNGEPYTPSELQGQFLDDYNFGYEIMCKATGKEGE